MKAVHIEKNAVVVDEVDMPEIGPADVLLETKASAVNRGEIFIKNGNLDVTYPQIPGYDVAGVVKKCGSDVSNTWKGKRVVVNGILPCEDCIYCVEGEPMLCRDPALLGQSLPGGHAEYVRIPADRLVELPDSTEFTEAAALPTAFGTVSRALVSRGTVRVGDEVLVIGASGGVGHAAVQLSRQAGATVFASTSSEEKAEKLKELGVDTVIRYDQDSIEAEIQANSKRDGVDLVFESVGGEAYESAIRSLRGGGKLVTVGATTGDASTGYLPHIFAKQLEVIGSSRYANQDLQRILRLLDKGHIAPQIDDIIELSEITEAYERLENREVFGRIVIDHS